VVAVVAHLIERQARGLAFALQVLGRDRGVARGERRIDRLARQADEPDVGRLGRRRQGRQQVGDVVGDPGTDGRERRDEV
jgi:hypothetical protein